MVFIGNVLLRYNGSSKELVIPEGIYMIGINAYNSDTIEKITLPSTVEVIGDKAFIN